MDVELSKFERSQGFIDRAIGNYLSGNVNARFELLREDGYIDRIFVSDMIEQSVHDDVELAALGLCMGGVLDVGAGMGRHTSILRDRGVSVTPLDRSERCVSYLKSIGFSNALHADICEPIKNKYDTILMLNNGIGMFGSEVTIENFFLSLGDYLAEGGALICDSIDIPRAGYQPLLELRQLNRAKLRDAGCVDYRIRIDDEVSEVFSWLYLTEEELTRMARSSGLEIEVVYRNGAGRYLSVISSAGSVQSSRIYQSLSLSKRQDIKFVSSSPELSKKYDIVADCFSISGYALLRHAISSDVAALITRYALLHLEAGGYFSLDGQVRSPSKYADTCGEALLDLLRPQFENIIGEELLPSYSYMRFYTNGSSLEKHRDRPACEISATLTLGYKCDHQWPIYIEVDGSQKSIELDVGDILLYQGGELPHWREEFKGEYWLQVFLHYVRRSGVHASSAYDGRRSIGPRIG